MSQSRLAALSLWRVEFKTTMSALSDSVTRRRCSRAPLQRVVNTVVSDSEAWAQIPQIVKMKAHGRAFTSVQTAGTLLISRSWT
jgi:hypothetical protein